MIHNVVVVGLGLMGGSMAKAVRAYTDCKVYGWNRTRAVAEEAIAEGTLDGFADDAALAQADLLVISLYPQSTIDWLQAHMEKLKPGCLIVDFVGVKQCMVDAITPLAQAHGVAHEHLVVVGNDHLEGLALLLALRADDGGRALQKHRQAERLAR